MNARTIIRHITPGIGNGGQAPERELHEIATPGQAFNSLYRAVFDAIQECGPCCRSDITAIPAFSNYSKWQIERALEAARLHGYLRICGPVHPAHPDAPTDIDPSDINWPQIYEVDPGGPLLDRTDTDALVLRALRTRCRLELIWHTPAT